MQCRRDGVPPAPSPPQYKKQITAKFAKDAKETLIHFFALFACLYVQRYQNRFYYASSCPRDDKRSEESCGHDDQPKTDCVPAIQGRREAWFKPISCLAARTAE